MNLKLKLEQYNETLYASATKICNTNRTPFIKTISSFQNVNQKSSSQANLNKERMAITLSQFQKNAVKERSKKVIVACASPRNFSQTTDPKVPKIQQSKIKQLSYKLTVNKLRDNSVKAEPSIHITQPKKNVLTKGNSSVAAKFSISNHFKLPKFSTLAECVPKGSSLAMNITDSYQNSPERNRDLQPVVKGSFNDFYLKKPIECNLIACQTNNATECKNMSITQREIVEKKSRQRKSEKRQSQIEKRSKSAFKTSLRVKKPFEPRMMSVAFDEAKGMFNDPFMDVDEEQQTENTPYEQTVLNKKIRNDRLPRYAICAVNNRESTFASMSNYGNYLRSLGIEQIRFFKNSFNKAAVYRFKQGNIQGDNNSDANGSLSDMSLTHLMGASENNNMIEVVSYCPYKLSDWVTQVIHFKDSMNRPSLRWAYYITGLLTTDSLADLTADYSYYESIGIECNNMNPIADFMEKVTKDLKMEHRKLKVVRTSIVQ